jgi:hypothetical protein
MFTCLRDLCEKIKAIQVGCMNYVTWIIQWKQTRTLF